MNIRIIFIFFFFFLSSSLSILGQKTSVYVSPHGDDWQLFMMPNAYHSIKNEDEKVLFLHTTAADAATGSLGENTFYMAREEGSMRAIRFLSNTFNIGAGLGANMNEEVLTINGHKIAKATYRNAVIYFLRVPDGNVDGSGYSMYNYECIEKLYSGEVEQMKAIDNSTTYSSIEDFRNTIKEIIKLEGDSSHYFEFHMADTDAQVNPGDHSDHIYSVKIMEDIASDFDNVTLNYYVEYYSAGLEQNIFDHDYMVSIGAWAVTASGLSDFYHNSTWNDGHNQWLGRQYFRTEYYGDILPYNVALNKPTSASNNEIGNPSVHAVDNNFSNWWGGAPYAQWWQVNLEDTFIVSSINVFNYYDGARYYQYDILASLDGINWTKIVDNSNNLSPANVNGDSFQLDNILGKYLRVDMKFNSANPGVHIVEFQAFGVPYSQVTSAENIASLNSSLKIEAYPNPIKIGSPMQLNLTSDVYAETRIQVFNLLGAKVLEKTITMEPGKNTIKLATHSFTNGFNMLKINSEGNLNIKKIVAIKN